MNAQSKKSPLERKLIEINDPTSNVEEEIRRRAYELYERRGRQDGYDLDDWLQAESEMMANGIKRTVAA